MANATQSTSPIDFMPRLRDYLAEALEIDRAEVKIATDESDEQKPHWIGEKSLAVVLNGPNPVNPNAGAGRSGFPVTRQLVIKLRTRGGLDAAGEDEIALAGHWAFEDEVINALLVLPHTEDKDAEFPYIGPIKYAGPGKGGARRVKNTVAAYESILVFTLTYIPRVTAP